jgi:hypothetical protein
MAESSTALTRAPATARDLADISARDLTDALFEVPRFNVSVRLRGLTNAELERVCMASNLGAPTFNHNLFSRMVATLGMVEPSVTDEQVGRYSVALVETISEQVMALTSAHRRSNAGRK